MYHGQMGWTYTELYNLPVHVRRYFYLKLLDTRKKERATAEDAAKGKK